MGRIAFILLLLVCIALPAEGATVTDSALGFTLDVPEGFVTLPAPGGDAIYGFATSFPEKGLPDAIVTISRMHEVLPRNHLNASRLPTATATLSSAKWRGLDIDVISDHLNVNGNTFAIRAALVPLKNEGIQMKVIAPIGKEAIADETLAKFLAGMAGASNWSAPPHADYSGVLFAGSLVFFVIALVVFFRRGRKSAPSA